MQNRQTMDRQMMNKTASQISYKPKILQSTQGFKQIMVSQHEKVNYGKFIQFRQYMGKGLLSKYIRYYDIGKFDTKYKLYKREQQVSSLTKYQKNLNHFIKDKFYLQQKIPKFDHLSQIYRSLDRNFSPKRNISVQDKQDFEINERYALDVWDKDIRKKRKFKIKQKEAVDIVSRHVYERNLRRQYKCTPTKNNLDLDRQRQIKAENDVFKEHQRKFQKTAIQFVKQKYDKFCEDFQNINDTTYPRNHYVKSKADKEIQHCYNILLVQFETVTKLIYVKEEGQDLRDNLIKSKTFMLKKIKNQQLVNAKQIKQYEALQGQFGGENEENDGTFIILEQTSEVSEQLNLSQLSFFNPTPRDSPKNNEQILQQEAKVVEEDPDRPKFSKLQGNLFMQARQLELISKQNQMMANQDKLKQKLQNKLELLEQNKDDLGQQRYACFVFLKIQEKHCEDQKKEIMKLKKFKKVIWNMIDELFNQTLKWGLFISSESLSNTINYVQNLGTSVIPQHLPTFIDDISKKYLIAKSRLFQENQDLSYLTDFIANVYHNKFKVQTKQEKTFNTNVGGLTKVKQSYLQRIFNNNEMNEKDQINIQQVDQISNAETNKDLDIKSQVGEPLNKSITSADRIDKLESDKQNEEKNKRNSVIIDPKPVVPQNNNILVFENNKQIAHFEDLDSFKLLFASYKDIIKNNNEIIKIQDKQELTRIITAYKVRNYQNLFKIPCKDYLSQIIGAHKAQYLLLQE